METPEKKKKLAKYLEEIKNGFSKLAMVLDRQDKEESKMIERLNKIHNQFIEFATDIDGLGNIK